MGSLYVLGARQRKLLLKRESEWNLYEAALILKVDTDTGAVRSCVEYESPQEVRATDTASIVFKSGTLVGDTLYACTSTEVLIFQLPSFRRIGYVSLPCFNDLHHVAPTSDGALLVVNTGLDMLVKLNRKGEVEAEWSVLGEDPWARFSRTVDYRLIASTKPHKSHPNFVFELEDALWVTRFRQRDAVCLNDSGRRIDIARNFPHDGLLFEGRLYFTLVDGSIAIANPQTLQVENVVDLKQIDNSGGVLGWCRGLLIRDDGKLWVGFSRFRKTRFTENVLWVKNILQDGVRERPTHIALYDLAARRCLREIELEAYGMNLIFSIFPAAE